MRIVFMGTPEFALPSLQILLSHSYTISAVVTAPDNPRGRGQKPAPSPVKLFAEERGLPLLQPDLLKNPAFISEIRALRPDLIVVVAFRILPSEVYSLASKGAFNLHASLLPKYRGAAPINWALMNGETETGVTTFFLQKSVDTGSIILQAKVRIGPEETAGELHDRLAEIGAEVVLQTVRLIELGKVTPRVQDESQATPAPKIFKDDCRIDWTRPAKKVHDFVRALSPVPGSWTRYQGTLIRVYRTRTAESPAASPAKPGTVVKVDKETLLVETGGGVISILEIQQEGRRKMGIREFLRGFDIVEGDEFGD